MTLLKTAQAIFAQHRGMMSTKELYSAKIFYGKLQELLKMGAVEKVRRGYYQWVANVPPLDIVLLKRLFPDAVYCLHTALYQYGYSDRVPDSWHMMVDKSINRKRFCLEYPVIHPYYVKPEILKLGVVDYMIDGVKVKMHDRDRVICDCLRYRNKMDSEIFHKAIQAYISDPQKNVSLLLTYSKKLRCTVSLFNMIEPWL